MKKYPSIPKLNSNIPNIKFHVFPKYDGSNIRAEWNYKKGFYKFGTRNELMDEKTSPFKGAISIIRNKFENDLSLLFKNKKWDSVICYFEYYGNSSFAGHHDFHDMNVTLIDINPYKKGFLLPSDFIECTSKLDAAKSLYYGNITEELIDSIKFGKLDGMPFEGCVLKGDYNNKLVMFKVKTQAWLDKLKDYCHNDDALFNALM